MILGPPGAGKGTQAENLSKKFEIPHLSAGDLLREAVSQETVSGKEAKPYISKGELVPDFIVLDIIEEKIKKYKDGFILDGFPRNIKQAKELDKYLKTQKKELDVVINLQLDENAILKRLRSRLICSKCGKIYNIESLSFDERCQNCGNKLRQRVDDKEETIRNRIKVYFKYTYPLLNYYREKGILRDVLGKGSPNEIFDEVIEHI